MWFVARPSAGDNAAGRRHNQLGALICWAPTITNLPPTRVHNVAQRRQSNLYSGPLLTAGQYISGHDLLPSCHLLAESYVLRLEVRARACPIDHKIACISNRFVERKSLEYMTTFPFCFWLRGFCSGDMSRLSFNEITCNRCKTQYLSCDVHIEFASFVPLAALAKQVFSLRSLDF